MAFRHHIAGSTALAVLLHAVLGCCAHHAHATERSCAASETADGDHVHNCEVREHGDSSFACHDDESHETPADHEHDYPGTCDEVRCAFAVAGKIVLVKSDFLGASFLSLIPAAAFACQGESQWHAFAWRPDGFAPSLRPHLLLQVMLI